MKTEYVIWGITPDGTGERLLATKLDGKPITDYSQATWIADRCRNDWNCHSVRIQTIEFPPIQGNPQDCFGFIKAINIK